MRQLLAVFALLLAALPTYGDTARSILVTTIVDNFDVTSAGYTYTAFDGLNTPLTQALNVEVWGPGRSVTIRVETTSSSTTVTAVTAGTNPFLGLVATDLVTFVLDGVVNERTITTFTDADTIVVNAAIDLDNSSADDGSGTGFPFHTKKLISGTGVSSGWFSVRGLDYFNVQAQVETFNATNITFTLECRTSHFGSANTINETVFTAVGASAVAVSTGQDQCRVGWKLTGDTGAQSVAAYIYGAR